MITESALVVRRSDRFAFVRSESQHFCKRCAEGRGCGSQLGGFILKNRLHEVRALACDPTVRPGDRVLLGLSGDTLLKTALLVYGLPLVFLFAGALAGAGGGEAGAMIGALAGLSTGLLTVRLLSRRLATNDRWQPVILRRLDKYAPTR